MCSLYKQEFECFALYASRYTYTYRIRMLKEATFSTGKEGIFRPNYKIPDSHRSEIKLRRFTNSSLLLELFLFASFDYFVILPHFYC